MKARLSILFSALIVAAGAFAQAKKPTLMVVPSDVWCNQNGYITEYDNQGTTVKVPDYQQALQNDMDLKLAISKINALMADRGFPLKDLEQQIKLINQQTAEMNITTSKSGNQMAETPTDRLWRTAKADIVLELTWDLSTQGPKHTLSFILEGKDSYTGKSIGAATGVSTPSFSAELPALLEEAVLAHIDNFNNSLQAYFDDLFANGREVALDIRVFEDNEKGIDLETEYNGMELSEIIDNWMAVNTVQGRFSKLGASEYYISYEQVRIPLYNAAGVAMDTESFARQLRKVLQKEPYNIPVKLLNRGLGRTILVLGEK